MIEFLDILADLYWVFILVTLLVLLALIGYNSVKKVDFVVKNEYRSNKYENDKQEVTQQVNKEIYNTEVLDLPSNKQIDKL